jgi:hypothetical protein
MFYGLRKSAVVFSLEADCSVRRDNPFGAKVSPMS